ncbi:protein dpy-30 homolog [Teleopsis dalmanni]|uniref:protein dpy-30 homolog n=1 Tax=Teleopsis dalmanni TaxID=139649 RepID=UPI0018CD919D|nr:protein dpy-30 homolog [Teleopsis dalmanni]XP_037939742.1 protein dpy-30 homolog [Teleopsis dalmanni]XP_037939891.1 protein dpy-30 homolog [Teleopsis dalmanni]
MKGKGKARVVEKFDDGPSTSAAAQQQSRRPTDVNKLPTRQYLDQTVAPVLLKGLQTVSRVRPADPIGFLADFLVKNRPPAKESSEAK